MITENLSTLKINKLSQAQYDRELAAGRIDANALYLTPDTTPNQIVYVQDTEPVGVSVGAIWLDTSVSIVASAEGVKF